MIVVVMRALTVAVAVSIVSCARQPPDPLQLDRNILTVDNRSPNDWNDVEIWLNTYYRITTPTIRAGSRFQATLDTFVAGFGQRFDFRRAQITDLRLVAKLPDGRPLELKKQFTASGLAGYLGGKR